MLYGYLAININPMLVVSFYFFEGGNKTIIMNVTIKNIEINPVNAELNQYKLDVRFKCNDCGNEYLVGEKDKDKCDEFMKSLKAGFPTKYIGCPKCGEKLDC